MFAAVVTLVVPARQASSSVDAAFAKFWAATRLADAAKAGLEVSKTEISFEEAYGRLKHGRPFDAHPPVGIVESRRGEYTYHLDVPATYDSARQYQVRFQLHGGIAAPRDTNERRGQSGIGRLAGAEQIYVLPAAWSDEPWWGDDQVENLHAILDTLKRSYNVNENRVVLSGVSDGGTGAFYVAMRDTTPYAAFLPLNGYILVLQHAAFNGGTDLFPANLENKPWFAVNGGRDPLYPMAAVEPTLRHLADHGVSITYRPQPDAGHDTTWWPKVKDEYESFVRDHPRVALPDRLTWETSDPRRFGRAHWLQIDALGSTSDDARDLPDPNVYTRAPAAELGFRLAPGLKIDRVIKDTMASRLGLERNDVIQQVGTTPIHEPGDLLGALQALPTGAPIRMVVSRAGQSIELSGTFDPIMVQPSAEPMFRRSGKSGRVDLARTLNTIDVRSRGVTQFTLLISPDQFDLNQPIKVVVNGRTSFEGRVDRNVPTLLKWAARDNDRTMLFAAEIAIHIP
jgi:hypothetical protein